MTERHPEEPRLREPRERVSPRARLMWALTAAVEGALLLAALVVAGPVTDWLGLGWVAVALVAAAVAAYVVVVPRWRYAVHRWEVTDTAVYTQTGWWARERRIAPMSRIQTVDHVEGAISRLFGLSTVTVTTASAAGALEIAGLDRDRALRLVDELTIKADTVPGDAT
jgi:membrane protein YdbS with pleckstrin-like domain